MYIHSFIHFPTYIHTYIHSYKHTYILHIRCPEQAERVSGGGEQRLAVEVEGLPGRVRFPGGAGQGGHPDPTDADAEPGRWS